MAMDEGVDAIRAGNMALPTSRAEMGPSRCGISRSQASDQGWGRTGHYGNRELGQLLAPALAL
jgi:hypothetical protein